MLNTLLLLLRLPGGGGGGGGGCVVVKSNTFVNYSISMFLQLNATQCFIFCVCSLKTYSTVNL